MTPWPRSRPITRKSRAASAAVRALVGSSMMRIVGLQREGLGDLDELLVADAEPAHGLPRVDPAFELPQQIAGHLLHGPVVQQAEGRAFLASEEDVGGGRELPRPGSAPGR